MCAIIDSNVVAEAFGNNRTPAGKAFRKSVDQGTIRLVVGGMLLDELDQNIKFRKWRAAAVQFGRVFAAAHEKVDLVTKQLRASQSCVSNDQHIIALAQVTGARLLFSNDEQLHRDFKNRQLIDGPQGKVYSTLVKSEVTHAHRRLLNDNSYPLP